MLIGTIEVAPDLKDLNRDQRDPLQGWGATQGRGGGRRGQERQFI